MSVNDEFYSLPPEDDLPKESGERRDEENRYAAKSPAKIARIQKAEREKEKRNSLVKMLAGALVSVTVITGVAGDDIFYRTHDIDLPNWPTSKYEMYTRMDSGLVDNGDRTAFLTEGYTAHSVGVLVSKEPIDLSEPITLAFDVIQSGYGEYAGGKGADGISVGFSRYENANDMDGGFLGYDGEFGIELDLCKNPIEETPGGRDYDGDHIAILGNSVWNAVAVTPAMNLDDGSWHHVEMEYGNSSVTVKFDKKVVLQGKIENSYKKLYLKISGTTGDGRCYQAVSNIIINGEIVLIDDDYAAGKNEYRVISDFEGDDTEIESLASEHEKENQAPKESHSQQDTVNDTGKTDVNQSSEGQSTEAGNTETGNTEAGNTETGNTEAENTEVNAPIEEKCLTCNGTGIICPGSVAADDPEGCHGMVIVDCKACNGTGYEANGRPCNWCKGTLKHLCPSFESHYECPDCNGTGLIGE